ncbi:MAG: glutamyl-tRNA reductase, partial [Actinobacteria bacterium]|nr:glutamyl-tRNA reductase [Actinomycetota bacterium]
MSIVVLGVNHRSAPLDVIEKVTISSEALANALQDLLSRDNIRETVVLSTCNRTEVYVLAEKFHGAYADVRDFFCELSGLTPDEMHPHFYSQHDDAAVSHLFEVASGLDSAVLGETEILGQVRTAWERARNENTARTSMNMLFRQALEVGKRARTETSISRSTASVSHAAVDMAVDLLGTMSGANVLVVGAGDMGAGIAKALAGAGAKHVTVMNRSVERAEELAQSVGAVVGKFDQLSSAVAHADVILTCTGAGEVIMSRSFVDA